MNRIEPILRYPGAKWNLADWIISNIPPHTTYLEPFFGSGAVLFNKPRSKVETINDIDGKIINLFKVLREQPDELARLVNLTPWSKEEYKDSYNFTGDSLEDARKFIVRCWQAFGGTAVRNSGWRNDVSGLQGSCVAKVWCSLPERILLCAERLKGVQIENMNYKDLIERYGHKDCLIYADPPYILSTRSGKLYENEMTDQDHIELLEILDQQKGPVLLSGYSHPLYDERLKHWSRQTRKAQAEKGGIREEVLWINPVASEMIMPSLF